MTTTINNPRTTGHPIENYIERLGDGLYRVINDLYRSDHNRALFAKHDSTLSYGQYQRVRTLYNDGVLQRWQE